MGQGGESVGLQILIFGVPRKFLAKIVHSDISD